MKTFILSFAILSTLCGCNGTAGLYVGDLTRTQERAGYKPLTITDSQYAVEATPSRTGKFIIITGLTEGPLFFERIANDLSLSTARNDREYDERTTNDALLYSEKYDFTSGGGSYGPTIVSIDLKGTQTVDQDGQKITRNITWKFYGSTLE